MTATPEQVAAVTAAIETGNAMVCYTKCWSCMSGFHLNPPAPHGWAGSDDIAHAKATGQPEPTSLCGCPCAHGESVPNIDAGMVENEDWDVDDNGDVIGEPCPECGEAGACAYDREGRPMIHTTQAE